MAIGKRQPEAVILSANALLDGAVVYHDGSGWTPHLEAARVARGDEVSALEALLAASEAQGDVVDALLLPVTPDARGRIVPNHYRERIRALGPTVRRDLGPQARGEHRHVSL
ncbi:MAG TPA: DUF2849 domain-containing protein [Allosphingosinicella sp.]|jgi:hypothetical protein